MHKITKKLFGYFTALAAFFAVTAFFGFLGVFRYFTYQHLENDLKARAGAIKDQLEQFMDQQGATHGQGQGRGAYLRFVNDIAMADAYILDEQGNPFTYGKNGTAGNMPTEDVLQFSMRIFTSGSYEHVRQKEAGGDSVFYVGVRFTVIPLMFARTAFYLLLQFFLGVCCLRLCYPVYCLPFYHGGLSDLFSRLLLQRKSWHVAIIL